MREVRQAGRRPHGELHLPRQSRPFRLRGAVTARLNPAALRSLLLPCDGQPEGNALPLTDPCSQIPEDFCTGHRLILKSVASSLQPCQLLPGGQRDALTQARLKKAHPQQGLPFRPRQQPLPPAQESAWHSASAITCWFGMSASDYGKAGANEAQVMGPQRELRTVDVRTSACLPPEHGILGDADICFIKVVSKAECEPVLKARSTGLKMCLQVLFHNVVSTSDLQGSSSALLGFTQH